MKNWQKSKNPPWSFPNTLRSSFFHSFYFILLPWETCKKSCLLTQIYHGWIASKAEKGVQKIFVSLRRMRSLWLIYIIFMPPNILPNRILSMFLYIEIRSCYAKICFEWHVFIKMISARVGSLNIMSLFLWIYRFFLEG